MELGPLAMKLKLNGCGVKVYAGSLHSYQWNGLLECWKAP